MCLLVAISYLALFRTLSPRIACIWRNQERGTRAVSVGLHVATSKGCSDLISGPSRALQGIADKRAAPIVGTFLDLTWKIIFTGTCQRDLDFEPATVRSLIFSALSEFRYFSFSTRQSKSERSLNDTPSRSELNHARSRQPCRHSIIDRTRTTTRGLASRESRARSKCYQSTTAHMKLFELRSCMRVKPLHFRMSLSASSKTFDTSRYSSPDLRPPNVRPFTARVVFAFSLESTSVKSRGHAHRSPDMSKRNAVPEYHFMILRHRMYTGRLRRTFRLTIA